MRAPCIRAVVTVLFVTFYVASGVASAFAVCCHHGASSDGPKMDCCLKGGPNHMCPFMAKRKQAKSPGGDVKALCAAGHDAGIPVAGFGAPPLGAIAVPMPSVSESRSFVLIEAVATRDLHPPSPPPKA